jgi:hypothetical protein
LPKKLVQKQRTAIKKPVLKKSPLKPSTNVQLKQKMVSKGDPIHRKTVKSMKPFKNRINDVQARV